MGRTPTDGEITVKGFILLIVIMAALAGALFYVQQQAAPHREAVARALATESQNEISEFCDKHVAAAGRPQCLLDLSSLRQKQEERLIADREVFF